jgi:hypothetical protein
VSSGRAGILISVVLLLAGVALLTASPKGQSAPRSQSAARALSCGGERWPVKTLSDGRVHLVDFHPPRRTTVNRLRHKRRPHIGGNSPRRRGAERKTFRVRARLLKFAQFGDHDIHMVISAPGHRSGTMIVEFPNVRCNGARRSIKRPAMRRARRHLRAACGIPHSSSFTHLRGKATITGVGFFDLIHGQTGQAPNGIELHPVLKFTDANC